MSSAPETRTATFLLTDIAGSTRLWEEHREAMGGALADHDAILRAAIETSGGTLVKTTGDGVLAAFDRPEAAVAAALHGQRALRDHAWGVTGPLHVRMAIHSGSAETRDGDFFGPALNRTARLLAIGHGDQVLISGAAAALVEDALPPQVGLLDRGEHRLRDLERPEHVMQLVAPDLPRDFPALRSATPQTNLPAELTTFVGRSRELAEVRRLLMAHRLVTLIGVGGTGKTRLLLRSADGVVERHEDGVWLVDLAPLSEPALVTPEVARALGIPNAPEQPIVSLVTDFLRGKDLLLLLDNCEHLIEAAADLTHRLLGSCPGLRVMATSREALGVEGEAVYQVPSLGLPPTLEDLEGAAGPEGSDGQGPLDPEALAAIESSEAVRLFLERARATLPDFALEPANAPRVVEICRRLDGIPLAIELAAARVNVLSVAEIAQGLNDRFRLLTGGRRTSMPRQQTLQALIDWSWDLLAEPDRQLLGRLSVFAGGWTLEAAADVTGEAGAAGGMARLATLDGLSRLVDRSLVVVERGEVTRYRMLETIRQYARDKLIASGEAEAVRDRHLAHYRALALEAGPRIKGPQAAASLGLLDAEVENLRAALDWAFETDLEGALGMTVALADYWRHRTIGSEGVDRLHQAVAALDQLPPPPPGGAAARAALGSFVLSAAVQAVVHTGRRREQAMTWAERADALARESGEGRAIVIARAMLALACIFMGRAPEERVSGMLEEIVPLAEAEQVWSELAYALATRAMYAGDGDPAAAEAWLQRASEAAARAGDPDAIAFANITRGRVVGRWAPLEETRRWFEAAYEGAATLADRREQLVARSDLAHAVRRAGLLDEAEAVYRETIAEWQHLGQRGAIANQLESFAFLARARGEAHRAAVLLGAAERLREEADTPMLAYETDEYEAEVAQVRAALAPDAFARGWAEGRALTTDDAVASARAG